MTTTRGTVTGQGGRPLGDTTNRGQISRPQVSANANADGSRPGGGMTDAQIKAAQDKANADRRAGKMSDLRGGGGNVIRRKTCTDQDRR